MQFGLDQDLPSHVVQSNQIPETAWSFYNRPSRGVKLYIPPRLFESDVSSRYVVWWRGLVAINEETVTKNIQNAKQSPMVSCGYEKAVKSLATSDCVEKEPKDYIAETVLTRAQVMSQSRKTGSSGKRTDLNNDSVLNSYDDIEEEEDSLTVAQLLNLSRKTESFEKATDDKLVLNTVTPRLLNCTSEPVELSVQIMSSPDKREKSKSLTKEQIEPKECAAVSRNLKFINVQGEMSVHGRSSSDNHKQSDFSTKRQTELGEDAARSPEENIVNLEEEICEDTTSNLQHLGLKARIWRLETIVDKIKAAKNAASSRGNAEK
ncbi:hypothetical protein POM88_025802 [Heracleum sosnowskyi]|uniref:Aminotransferase-like plant mobile domain-containing protein n=1 Tax=Heracleum sosnowskyi TaxID=360622 RepID=A0AAD8I593_9APIA|nr:hypothetical protein POM88_025802 [Heracleum sosnowskyi]